MGIDIFAEWDKQSKSKRKTPLDAWLATVSADIGYLRESYHGEPYATRFLFAEAFASETGKAQIPAETLESRLPMALKLVEERARKLYEATDEEVEQEKQSFCDFVELCARKEQETGEAMRIFAWY